jgi:Flp pilus assembly protein CpaB
VVGEAAEGNTDDRSGGNRVRVRDPAATGVNVTPQSRLLGSRPETAVGPRTLRRRRGVPSARAVVGGFLIAAAAVGLFGAHLSVTAGPRDRFVVAAVDLPAGSVITARDVTLVPVDLPEPIRSAAFRSPETLVGAIVLARRDAGQLVQAGDVARFRAGAGSREVSFAVDANRAVGGQLRPGERVDVLATYGTGDAAYTTLVVSNALVTRAGSTSGALVGEGGLQLTLALQEVEAILAVVHAVDAGQVTVVRATTADGVASPGGYRPSMGQGDTDGPAAEDPAP